MEGPEPATFVHALSDLGCNRLIAVVRRHALACGSTYAGLFVLIGLLVPEFLGVMLAPIVFFLLLLAAYFAAEWAFVFRIQSRQPRCPHCKSVHWQLQCGYCARPVPVLALLFGGAFLRHCPHCDAGLSDRAGTLLAWCHACGATRPHPSHHYARPTNVWLELSTTLPQGQPAETQDQTAGWFRFAEAPIQELQRATTDEHAILYRLTPDTVSGDALPAEVGELLPRVCHVWIGEGVDEFSRQNLIGRISEARGHCTLSFAAPALPDGIHAADWGAVYIHVNRPSHWL